MHRSLLPFLLASLGFFLLARAVTMTLFEWEISELATDFPPNYDVQATSSPWKAYLGESLEQGFHNFFGGIGVSKDGDFCRPGGLNFVVIRSQNDEVWERLLNIPPIIKPWLFAWISLEVLLSITYMVLDVLENKQGSSLQVIFLTGVVGFICIFLIQVMRLFGSFPYYFFPDNFDFGVPCSGTITFHAVLTKVHYETLLALGAGILTEVGALGVMFRQIKRAVSEGKESSKSEVG